MATCGLEQGRQTPPRGHVDRGDGLIVAPLGGNNGEDPSGGEVGGSLHSVLLDHFAKCVHRGGKVEPGAGWIHSWAGIQVLLCSG